MNVCTEVHGKLMRHFQLSLKRPYTVFHKHYLKKTRDLEVSTNTTSPVVFRSLYVRQQSNFSVSRVSLERWLSTSMTRPTMGLESAWQWRLWNKRWLCARGLDEGDWDLEVPLSQHCQVQGLLYWTWWVLICYLSASYVYWNILYINIQCACSVLSFSSRGRFRELIFCSSVNIENLFKVQNTASIICIFNNLSFQQTVCSAPQLFPAPAFVK